MLADIFATLQANYPVAAGVLAAGGVGYWLLRRRKRKKAPPKAKPETKPESESN